jgi:hypothetical protein
VTRASIAVAATCLLFVLLVVAGRPKLTMGIAFCAIISSRTLLFATDIDPLGYLDEACVGAVFVWQVLLPLIMGRRVRSFPGLVWFGAFAFMGLLSALAAGVPLTWALNSAYLALKGILFGWAVAQLDWEQRDIRAIARLGSGLAIVIVVAGAINLIIPEAWTAVLANDGKPDHRGFVPSVIGPFVHPGEFGVATALASIAIAAWIFTHKATAGNVALLIASLVGCALSFRRKSAVGGLAALVWLGSKTSRARTVLIVALAAPVILISVWSTLANVVRSTRDEYIADPYNNARIVLTLGAFDVANEHFPLGAGFARYGSYLAQVHYSSEYTERHFARIWGLGRGGTPPNNFALTDTMWPAVIGETGYAGAIAFGGGLVMIHRSARSRQQDTDPDVRWLALVVGGWSVELAFESIAMAAYTAPPMFPLLFGAAGVLYAVNSKQGAQAGAQPMPLTRRVPARVPRASLDARRDRSH